MNRDSSLDWYQHTRGVIYVCRCIDNAWIISCSGLFNLLIAQVVDEPITQAPSYNAYSLLSIEELALKLDVLGISEATALCYYGNTA